MLTNDDLQPVKTEVAEPECLLLDDDWIRRHSMECEVSRRLTQHPGLEVHNLVVRRIPGGVCLEGRVVMHETQLDLQELMQGITGLKEIRNRLLMTPEPDANTVDPIQRDDAQQ